MAITERTKPNFQPWDETAFSAEKRVQRLTPLQRGMYRTLLQQMFVCTTRPYLPAEDSELWILADCESEARWLENKAAILPLFYETKHEGRPALGQTRVTEDWNAYIGKRQSAVERGHRGGVASVAKRPHPPAPTEYEGGDKGVLDEIRRFYSEKTGKETEPKLLPTQEKRLAELVRIRSAVVVLGAFYQWMDAQVLESKENPYPIGSFLKEAPMYLALSETDWPATRAPDATAGYPRASLDRLLTDLALLSDGKVMFGAARHRAALAVMLRDYELDEVLGQFKLYYDSLEDKQDLKWAAQTFCENGLSLLAAHRKAIAEQKAKVQKMDEIVAQRDAWVAAEFPTPEPAVVEHSPDDDLFEIEVTE